METQQPQDIAVIIPALNPDDKMVAYVKQLLTMGFLKIILVNDGSDRAHQGYFDQFCEEQGVQVLHHPQNRGKGCALKTGFAWCLAHMPQVVGVVTADSDGQHAPADTMRVALALQEHPDALILGVRDFDRKEVPFQSRYGNKITSVMFALLFGKRLHDTQTGLRGIPATALERLCKLPGDRYEYESRMLIAATKDKISFLEVPIETIYIDDNAASHFRPWRDSARIYGVLFGSFLRYVFSSLSASVIDLGLFTLLNMWVLCGLQQKQNIILSTVLARVVSTLYNFGVNRTVVFRSQGKLKTQMLRYYTLAVVQMLCSAGLLYVFTWMSFAVSWWVVPMKMIVDTCLFFVSYQIQHRFIF